MLNFIKKLENGLTLLPLRYLEKAKDGANLRLTLIIVKHSEQKTRLRRIIYI
jgi:hypothetical protein